MNRYYSEKIIEMGGVPATGRGNYLKNKSMYELLLKNKVNNDLYQEMYELMETYPDYDDITTEYYEQWIIEEKKREALENEMYELMETYPDYDDITTEYYEQWIIEEKKREALENEMYELMEKDISYDNIIIEYYENLERERKIQEEALLNMPVTVTVTLSGSEDIVRTLSSTLGITRANIDTKLKELCVRNFPNFSLKSYKIDETVHIVEDYDLQANNAMMDYLEEELYSNFDGDCVTQFKKAFDIDDYEYYDGMKMRDFIVKCNEHNIQIYNNYLQKVNNVEKPKNKVIAYSGHVIPIIGKMPTNACVRENVIMNDDEFERTYLKMISNPDENIITDVKTYQGVYGEVLTSFQLLNDNKVYKRDGLRVGKYENICYTPTQVIKEVLGKYSCFFNNPYEKNHAVYSGIADIGDYGYDLNQAYINAFKNIREIPIIDNFPVPYERALKLDKNIENWIVLTDEFKYNNIDFSKSLLFMDEALNMNAPIIECYYISNKLKMNGEEEYKTITELIENNFNPSCNTNYKHYNILKKGNEDIININDFGRNKYVECCLRYALGDMISTRNEKYSKCFVSYLSEICNTTKCNYILNPLTKLSTKKQFYTNIHLAMSKQYRKMLLEVKDPKAVFCDCVYSENCLELGNNWKQERELKYVKVCKKDYNTYDLVNVITGRAGSGKTYQMMQRLNKEDTLVIIPQYRLKTTWEGFNCTSYQRIEKNFKFDNVKTICVDEAFQMDGKTINIIIGMAYYYNIKLYLVGDPLQFAPVNKYNNVRDFMFRYMKVTEQIKGNYRNNIDYVQIFKEHSQSKNQTEYRKSIFDKYLGKYLIDNDYENPVYCFKTGRSTPETLCVLKKQLELCLSEDLDPAYQDEANETITKLKNKIENLEKYSATQLKHEKLYQEHVKASNVLDYYVRCVKNTTIDKKTYYNGVIYTVNDDIREHRNFVISNVYSIYTTQGQTMEKINLLKDDYELYYSNIEMLYVLISRIKF